MSLRIFIHSLRQVFGNLGGALQVSGVLTLVQFALMVTLGRDIPVDDATRQQMILNGQMPWGRIALMGLLGTIIWLWIVVGWHRYVLLNERASLVPGLKLDRMLGYFGKSLLIALILVPLALILSFVGGGIATALFQGGAGVLAAIAIMAIIVYVPVATVGLRLGTMLPGAALQPDVPLFSGWDATRGATGTILGVVALSVLFGGVLELLGSRLFSDAASLPAMIYGLGTQWVVAMVGASILTTLYGHYIEKRPLV